MKHLLFILLFISTSFLLPGQDFKTKKKKENTAEGTAHYYVLADNDTIKQGLYIIRAYTGNRVLLEGQYSKNKKVGLWREQYYGKEYKGPKACGYYDNDRKVGEWCYFNFNGDTIQIYNWSESKLILSKNMDAKKEYTVIQEGNEKKIELDSPPTCISGLHYFSYEFAKNIGEHSDYFKNLGNKLYQLKTSISITIDSNFSVVGISYTTYESKEIQDIIEKFIKSFLWIPGKKDGKYLTTKIEFPVNIECQF